MRSSLVILLYCCIWAGQASWAQTKKIDSLRQYLLPALPDSIRVRVLNELAQAWLEVEPRKALPFVEKSVQLATNIRHKKGAAQGYCISCVAHGMLGNYIEAIEQCHKSLALYETLQDSLNIANVYNNFSNLYAELNEKASEIEYLEKSTSIYKKYPQAKYQITLSYILNNLGDSYIHVQKYDSAKTILQLAYRLRKQYQPEKIGSVLAIMGKLAYTQQKYGYAYQHLQEALQKPQSFNNRGQRIDAMTEMAKTNLALDSTDKAQLWAEKALQEAQKYALASERRNAHEILATIYARKQLFEKAFLHSQETQRLQDSIRSQLKIKEIAKIQISAYQQKKELENTQLQEKNAQQRYWLWLSVGTSCVILGLLLYAVWLYWKRRKAYHTIAKQALDLQKASIEIAQLNHDLAETVARQDKSLIDKDKQIEDYLFINAHRVRSPLATLLGLVQIIHNKQYNSEEELLYLLEHVYNNALKLDNILFEINETLHEGLEK